MALQEKNPNIDAALVRADDAASRLIHFHEHAKATKSIQDRLEAAKQDEQENVSKSAKHTEPAPKKKKASPKGPTAADLSTISLEGEDTESVPIYATASDMRKQIKQYLSSTKCAKTAFARELNELMPSTKIEVRGLDRFLKATGPKGAGHNPVFYAAYVFFEKKRVKEGKKKTAKREEMEKIWKEKGGFPRDSNNRITCCQGDRPTIDQYGRWHLIDGRTGVKKF